MKTSKNLTMSKISKNELEQVLGIFEPWYIEDVKFIQRSEQMHIVLAQAVEKTSYSLLGINKRRQKSEVENSAICRWNHIRLGKYSTVIETKQSYVEAALSQSVSAVKARIPFIGEIDKDYSFHLEQLVRIASSRQVSMDNMSAICQLDMDLLKKIQSDISESLSSEKYSNPIPPDTDPVWRGILTDKTRLSTKLFPLKLLLSNLKLKVSERSDDPVVLQKSVAELRSFFESHASELKNEIAQVSGGFVGTARKAQNANKVKLILPGVKNQIWHEVLTGVLKIPTNNMALNLLISKMRLIHGRPGEDRAKLYAELRSFFHKNARTLKPELLFLTKQLQKDSSPQTTTILPASNHSIWQRILYDDGYLPANNLPYQLLLTNLRASLGESGTREAEANAANRLRMFFIKNQGLMKKEVNQIIQLAQTA